MNYRIDLAVLSEQKQNCRFGLTVHNLSDVDIKMSGRCTLPLTASSSQESLSQGDSDSGR